MRTPPLPAHAARILTGHLTSLVLGLALATAAACSDGGDEPMDGPMAPPDGAVPREVIMENVPLVVSEVAEAIMKGGPGDYAHIVATTATPALDWNLHGHAGGGTQIVKEELRVMTVDYQFAPSAQADWFLLLRNKGQTDITLELKIELFGDMTWSGWQ